MTQTSRSSDVPVANARKPGICFVAQDGYGALTDGSSGHIGGVERQTSLMARWFARRGYSVTFVVWDEGQPDGTQVDGVRVLRVCKRGAGIPGIRFFHPKWTTFVAALRRARADVYYQNCGEYVTGQVALWCRRHRRKFVYSVASDPDCDARLPEMHTLRERILYRYGLQHADRVIVQTRIQQEMLRRGFSVDSQVVPMPCPGPTEAEYTPREPPAPGDRRVLWVGRISREKRPDRLLEVADQCPELEFDLVGPVSDSQYAGAIHERAKRAPNITVHGSTGRDQVSGFYQRAACLCCTSDYEGFPNTFLEAWSHGLPIVSTVDPDNLIARRGLGAVSDDVPCLVAGIRGLLGSAQRWRRVSAAAREYYLANHAVEKAMSLFEGLVLDVADGGAGPRALGPC